MRQALAVGWISFAYLSLGSSSAHYWLDSGEIGAAGAELGVVHPPGVPGLALLLRLGTIVPIGSLGFRMALVSSALAAAALTAMFVLLRRHRAHPALCWGAVVWVLAGLTFVRQARVVEIYAFAAFLVMITMLGLDPAVERGRRCGFRLVAVFAAVWATWGFGDLRLALPPLVIVLWLRDLRRGRAWVRWAPLVVALATLPLLTLPLSSARAPICDWGDPDGLGALWDHLAAQSIRGSFEHEILPASLAMWLQNLDDTVARLSEDLGPLGLPLSLVALAWAILRPTPTMPRWVGVGLVWLVIVEMFYAVGINPMGGRDRQTGIVLTLVAVIAVATQAQRSVKRLPRARWAVLPLLGTLLVLPAALVSLRDIGGTRSWAPHAWVRAAIAQVPPGGLLLTQSDDLAAGILSARVVEGARPDLISVPAQHLYKPMSERSAARPRERLVWDAAAGRPNDAARIGAAIEAFPGVVALELPATGLFSEVPWWSPWGRLPLKLSGSEGERDDVADAISRWLPELQSREDRRRLAVAIANHARALVRVRGDLAGAEAALEAALREVTDELPSALVALAALHDRRGRSDSAITLTRRALELEPARSVALTNLALYLSRDPAGLEEALDLAERAAALRPWRRDVWLRLAQVRDAAGQAELAELARTRARALQ